MSKHTPGPWVWNESFAGLQGASGPVLYDEGYAGMCLAAENEEANARLIAAAPDILEALQALSNLYAFAWDRVDGGLMIMDSGVERFDRAYEKASAAIAKATGEPK